MIKLKTGHYLVIINETRMIEVKANSVDEAKAIVKDYWGDCNLAACRIPPTIGIVGWRDTSLFDKAYYAKLYTDFINEISEKLYKEGYYPDTDVTNAEIDERFEETANAKQIVGYYIHNEGNEALIAWQRNTEGITFSEKDKEVDKILKELYSE